MIKGVIGDYNVQNVRLIMLQTIKAALDSTTRDHPYVDHYTEKVIRGLWKENHFHAGGLRSFDKTRKKQAFAADENADKHPRRTPGEEWKGK